MTVVVSVDVVVEQNFETLRLIGVARDMQRVEFRKRQALGKQDICIRCEGDISPARRAEDPEAVCCSDCLSRIRGSKA
jgi:RNA polymerase-binding transcription factor DksA